MRASLSAVLLLASVASTASCRLDIDTPEAVRKCEVLTISVCEDGVGHDDIEWIDEHILKTNCTGQACHEKDSTDSKAKLQVFDQGPQTSYETLVKDAGGKQLVSDIDGANKAPLVVPLHPEQSYLYFIMRGVDQTGFQPAVAPPPDTIGFMPKDSDTAVCCQKLDAIKAWIEAGALPPSGT
jgi:hypothetical protein